MAKKIFTAKNAGLYKKAISAFPHLNTIIDGIRFQIIPTLEDLEGEGKSMEHCAFLYQERIREQNFLILCVQNIISSERATMGLYRKDLELTLSELKGFKNSKATNKIIYAAIKFCERNNIIPLNRNSDLVVTVGEDIGLLREVF